MLRKISGGEVVLWKMFLEREKDVEEDVSGVERCGGKCLEGK